MQKDTPEWFTLSEEATRETMKRISDAVTNVNLPLQVQMVPRKAHWFMLDSLYLANLANREGMHANALSNTRQCIEALSILELGLSQNPKAHDLLLNWEGDKVSSGGLRKWLEANQWNSYGTGLWDESWSMFMGKLARAIQPYAHYSSRLSQWQERNLGLDQSGNNGSDSLTAYIEVAPRAYDPQKATRITLYHALLTFALARIWLSANPSSDNSFADLTERLRLALGKSKYLDGHQTDWDNQFWAFLFFRDGNDAPE